MVNIKANISGITGQTPYDIYICQSSIDDCIYINTITGTTYSFDIPKPFDNNIQYILKVIDNNGVIINKSIIVNS
jgi:hypothetical protein